VTEIKEVRRVIGLAVEYIAEAINDEIHAFAGNERISNIDAMRGDLADAKNVLTDLESMTPQIWVEEAFKEAVEMLGPCWTSADTLWHDSKARKRLTER